MTKEEKQLLLVDLCGRLPYGVKVKCILDFRNDLEVLESKDLIEFIPKSFSFDKDGIVRYLEDNDEFDKDTQDTIQDALDMEEVTIDNIIPYLRPMSSMTEEEEKEYYQKFGKGNETYTPHDLVDWLNAHHFDYRDLIEKGLALEAPKDMYGKEAEK